MKVIMKCVNIKLLDLLGCFHYILNAPRTTFKIYSMCYDIKPVKTKERKFYWKIPLGVGDATREK